MSWGSGVSPHMRERLAASHEQRQRDLSERFLAFCAAKRPGDPLPAPRRIAPVVLQPTYVFHTFSAVFEPTTLARVESAYQRSLAALPASPTTLPDGSLIVRSGRLDVNLPGLDNIQLLPEVAEFVRRNMHGSVRLAPGVRALVVRGPTPNQAWHQDHPTDPPEPRYATLIVALGRVTSAMGPTEFQVADPAPTSGVLRRNEIEGVPGRAKPLLRRGEGLVFDGRITHRGTSSSITRVPVVYLVFRAPAASDPNL